MESVDYCGYINKSENQSENLTRALEYIDWESIIRRDDVVFIKPNFTFPSYKAGVTTNPELLDAILSKIKNRAQRIIVGESNGGMNSFTADEAFRGHDNRGTLY